MILFMKRRTEKISQYFNLPKTEPLQSENLTELENMFGPKNTIYMKIDLHKPETSLSRVISQYFIFTVKPP